MNKSCVNNTVLESWGEQTKEKKGTEAKTYLWHQICIYF